MSQSSQEEHVLSPGAKENVVHSTIRLTFIDQLFPGLFSVSTIFVFSFNSYN